MKNVRMFDLYEKYSYNGYKRSTRLNSDSITSLSNEPTIKNILLIHSFLHAPFLILQINAFFRVFSFTKFGFVSSFKTLTKYLSNRKYTYSEFC